MKKSGLKLFLFGFIIIIALFIIGFIFIISNKKYQVTIKYNNNLKDYVYKVNSGDTIKKGIKRDLKFDQHVFVDYYETYNLSSDDYSKILENSSLESTICKNGFNLNEEKNKCISIKPFDFNNTKVTSNIVIEAIWKEVNLSISPVTKEIYVGDSFDISVSISDSSDNNVIFSSMDESIASVDVNGKVVGLKEGKTAIIVESSGIQKRCIVIITKKEDSKPEQTTNDNNSTKLNDNEKKTDNVNVNNTGDSSDETTTITTKKNIKRRFKRECIGDDCVDIEITDDASDIDNDNNNETSNNSSNNNSSSNSDDEVPDSSLDNETGNKLKLTREDNKIYYDTTLFNPDEFMHHTDMVPGGNYVDELIIKNATKTKLTLYLKIDEPSQNALSDELLNNIFMKVYLNNSLIYNGKVKGLDYNLSGINLQDSVLLKEFAKNEAAKIRVELQLSPDYDNKDYNDYSYLNWKFIAQFDVDNDPTPNPQPKTVTEYEVDDEIVLVEIVPAPITGLDYNYVPIVIASIGVCTVACILIIFIKKKKKENK